MRSIFLHGKGESVSVSAVAAEIAELRNMLRDTDTKSIFNVDETVLIFKPLLRETYITEHEAVKLVRRTKAVKSKDSITAHVCRNLLGDKVPMVVIRTKTQGAFELTSHPCPVLCKIMFGQTL